MAEGERLTETVMETERAGKQREEPTQKESDIEIIGKEEGERLKETRESWMGMPAKNCDQREKKSRRKGRSEAPGRKEGSRDKLPGSCFQQSTFCKGALLHTLRLTASAPHLPPRSWFQGTAGLESLPASSPSVA